jgi:hypothetical protein
MDIGQQLCGEGENQECVKREKRGSFYRRGGGSPKEGVASQGEASPPLHGPLHCGNSLFMVVTPSST